MTDNQLQRLTQRISINYFHKPFLYHCMFNPELYSTWGYYSLITHNICINPKILGDFNIKDLIETIKHELCHYHLDMAGYKGTPHGWKFRRLNAKVGGASGWRAIYCPAPKNAHAYRYYYRCVECGQIYVWEKPIDTRKYGCGICGGRLIRFRGADLTTYYNNLKD